MRWCHGAATAFYSLEPVGQLADQWPYHRKRNGVYQEKCAGVDPDGFREQRLTAAWAAGYRIL
ncbi:hypothetical protein [Paenibacillus sp. LjRoot56]|uniref:hypothetical protein n=1 Tax=Paenibacillus sp. LjRoot56 TaxID=3342333 RepID=UPI003ECDB7B1